MVGRAGVHLVVGLRDEVAADAAERELVGHLLDRDVRVAQGGAAGVQHGDDGLSAAMSEARIDGR